MRGNCDVTAESTVDLKNFLPSNLVQTDSVHICYLQHTYTVCGVLSNTNDFLCLQLPAVGAGFCHISNLTHLPYF
jgi:hypothetical protein